jgi:cysteinyl-tRNA synthetase
MGRPRFSRLVSLLPQDVSILGLDEHTACILDFENDEAVIKGIGTVTLQRSGSQMVFDTRERFSLEVLRGGDGGKQWKQTSPVVEDSETDAVTAGGAFWNQIHQLETNFYEGLETHEAQKSSNALLELDRTIWKAQQDLENPEFISQAREVLRELIVLLGMELAAAPKSLEDCLAPLVGDLIQLRENFRQKKQWKAADTVRKCLERSGAIIEDTKNGPQWRLKS